MKVLMFGWEFPPRILGGLGTASYGLTRGLAAQGDMDISFVIPKSYGDEDQSFLRIIGANTVPIVWRDISYDYALQHTRQADEYFIFRQGIRYDFSRIGTDLLGRVEFSGVYPQNLHEEIYNYEAVASVIAHSTEFDIIHSHDWLTYPAGIFAKKISGKPLVIHVHATDYDRSRGNVNPEVYRIEKQGMDEADHIIAVSDLTKQTIIDKYHISPDKITTLHNAVEPLHFKPKTQRKDLDTKVITFLGRITMQKGPEYFVEVASIVLSRVDNVRFVMAGSGDMMEEMIALVAEKGISDKFHFTGFLKGDAVYEMLSQSDVYIMPSVSEPFGISPLEAMQCGTPSIISFQSGCAEILRHALKADYWDTLTMADYICSIVKYPAMYNSLHDNGLKEISEIRWEYAGQKLKRIYEKVLGR